MPAVAEQALPMSLLARFTGEGFEPLERLLRFVSPITTRPTHTTGAAV